jgi:uncharacterized protein YneF (UPF0154 family)
MEKLSFILGAITATVYFIFGFYVCHRMRQKEPEKAEDKPIVNDKALKSITDSKGFFSYKKYKGERGDKD